MRCVDRMTPSPPPHPRAAPRGGLGRRGAEGHRAETGRLSEPPTKTELRRPNTGRNGRHLASPLAWTTGTGGPASYIHPVPGAIAPHTYGDRVAWPAGVRAPTRPARTYHHPCDHPIPPHHYRVFFEIHCVRFGSRSVPNIMASASWSSGLQRSTDPGTRIPMRSPLPPSLPPPSPHPRWKKKLKS